MQTWPVTQGYIFFNFAETGGEGLHLYFLEIRFTNPNELCSFGDKNLQSEIHEPQYVNSVFACFTIISLVLTRISGLNMPLIQAHAESCTLDYLDYIIIFVIIQSFNCFAGLYNNLIDFSFTLNSFSTSYIV